MVRIGFVIASLLLQLASPEGQARAPIGAVTTVRPTYDEFMSLGIAQRRTTFATLDAPAKTLLVRMHGERWLARNRTRLTTEQSATIQAFVDYVPELFRDGMSHDSVQRELELTKAIRCQVGEAAFAEAFAILHPPPEHRRAWRDVVDEWLEWIGECLG